VSSRRIAAGEELLYDYGAGRDTRHAAPGPEDDPAAEPAEQAPASPQRLVRCRCGHNKCRQWIF
jgi:hypothetical protein